MNGLLSHANYLIVVVLMMGGLFILLSTGNLIKKMIGLAILQTSTGFLYISLAKVWGGTAAILVDQRSPAAKSLAAPLDPAYVTAAGVDGVVYSNPLPHVLILTAIVVGVATLAVGLAIAVRIQEAYGTIEEADLVLFDRQDITEVNHATGSGGGR